MAPLARSVPGGRASPSGRPPAARTSPRRRGAPWPGPSAPPTPGSGPAVPPRPAPSARDGSEVPWARTRRAGRPAAAPPGSWVATISTSGPRSLGRSGPAVPRSVGEATLFLGWAGADVVDPSANRCLHAGTHKGDRRDGGKILVATREEQ